MTVKELLLQAIDLSSETHLAQTLTFLQTLNQNTLTTSDLDRRPSKTTSQGTTDLFNLRSWEVML